MPLPPNVTRRSSGSRLAERLVGILAIASAFLLIPEHITGRAAEAPQSSPRASARVITDEERAFWSFPPLGQIKPPKLPGTASLRNPIDSFIQSALRVKGLKPTPPANSHTLVRRLWLDLLGVPPSADDVEQFSNDRSEDSWERLVRKLLEDPRYGERWARHWMDLARFAESHGFEHDSDRPNAYHYRDFLIQAFNQDLPYDTFVKWQLAGDEYEPSNPMALMATGFLAAGVHATQITANQVEKERYDELDDMARTTGTAMLGLTIGCARCHDHKFDPIPAQDYYRIVSSFTTTVRSDYDVDFDPVGFKRAQERFDEEHAPLTTALKRYENDELPRRAAVWIEKNPPALPPRWTVLEPSALTAQNGTTFTHLPDSTVLATGKNPDSETYTFVTTTHVTPITAVRLEVLPDSSLVKNGPGRAPNGNFALGDFKLEYSKGPDAVSASSATNRAVFKTARADFEQKGLPVAAAIDNSPTSAWAIDPQFGTNHVAVFELAEPLRTNPAQGLLLKITLDFQTNAKHQIGRFRLSVTSSGPPFFFDGEWLAESVQDALIDNQEAGFSRLSKGEQEKIAIWFAPRDQGWRELRDRIEAHANRAPKPTKSKVLISSEGVPPLRLNSQGADFFEQTYHLKRGDVNQKTGVANPGFLQVLMRHPDKDSHWQQAPPTGSRTSYRRRALAEWITDTEYGAGPLLARVIANRVWMWHFGRGLVSTPSDFGVKGDIPTHPELLDYLAVELVRSGWSLKHLHHLILASATYRQGNEADAGNARTDPENLWWWRFSPRRLEAEAIRDSVLHVSGALDARLYGPGTLNPAQPRRSLYFTVKRSRLVPMMSVFDWPDALGGVERRPTTTVAPQSLLILNNPVIRHYAETLAKRVQRERAGEAQLRTLYRLVLARNPSTSELASSLEFVRFQCESYQVSGTENPEITALADFSQALFGLNEFAYLE